MTIFYSAARRGFFDPQVHDSLPGDCVKITAKRHRELLAAQESGAEIVPGAGGRPAIRKPAATDVRPAIEAQVNREAARRIAAISPLWRQLNDQREPSEEGARRFALIDAVRAASDLIAQQLAEAPSKALGAFPVRNNPLWPETD